MSNRFLIAFAFKNGSKIMIEQSIFRKRRCNEFRAPVEAKLVFFKFRAFKIRWEIDARMHWKKASDKLPKNSVLVPMLVSKNFHFGRPKPPNPFENHSNSKLVSGRYGPHPEIDAS